MYSISLKKLFEVYFADSVSGPPILPIWKPDSCTHKSHIYLEYHNVCPLVGIGTPPHPLPQASVSLPQEPKGGGGTHSPAGEEVGESKFRRPEKSLALRLLYRLHKSKRTNLVVDLNNNCFRTERPIGYQGYIKLQQLELSMDNIAIEQLYNLLNGQLFSKFQKRCER